MKHLKFTNGRSKCQLCSKDTVAGVACMPVSKDIYTGILQHRASNSYALVYKPNRSRGTTMIKMCAVIVVMQTVPSFIS